MHHFRMLCLRLCQLREIMTLDRLTSPGSNLGITDDVEPQVSMGQQKPRGLLGFNAQ